SEHIETLQEIDIEYRELAHRAGISDFRRVPALNADPQFIAGLVALVRPHLCTPGLASSAWATATALHA
ncbi:MAG: ferrochelatase, partial [Thermostichus sp. DG02_2_bins_29]